MATPLNRDTAPSRIWNGTRGGYALRHRLTLARRHDKLIKFGAAGRSVFTNTRSCRDEQASGKSYESGRLVQVQSSVHAPATQLISRRKAAAP